MIKTPKLLPWYARKAGVPIERATALWHKAVREATAETGWVGNAEYWGEAMSRFVRLLEEDEVSFCEPRVTHLVRRQNRLWSLPLAAMEAMVSAVAASQQRSNDAWRRLA